MNSLSMLSRSKTHRTERPGEVPIWMKIRIDPNQEEHAIIDRYLNKLAPADKDFEFEKHESGPEILVYLKVTAAGLSLAKSVIELIRTIIKARSETRKKSARPFGPIKLVARRIDKMDNFDEGLNRTDEIVLRIDQKEASDETAIEQKLMEAVRKVARHKKQRVKK